MRNLVQVRIQIVINLIRKDCLVLLVHPLKAKLMLVQFANYNEEL